MNQPQGAGSANCSCAAFTDKVKCALTRALNVVKDPANIWTEIKSEPDTIQDLFRKYILILAAIPPLGQLIQGLYSGRFVLGMAIMMYVLALAVLWITSFVLRYITPRFDGTADQTANLKLIAYASAPAWLGGVFYLIPMPFIAGLLTFLCLLYSLYVLWQGITPMLGVPESKRIFFIIVLVVVYLVLSLVLGLLAAPVIFALNFGGATPPPPA